jgi:hypothetical protein
MRTSAAVVLASMMLCVVPTDGVAQEKTSMQSGRLVPGAPGVGARPALPVANVGPAAGAATGFPDRFFRRLQPIQQRIRENPRLRAAGAVLGLGAIAVGAVHSRNSLTFVGAQALRFGLERQLTQMRNRSGLVLEPSIAHRAITITVSRTFD